MSRHLASALQFGSVDTSHDGKLSREEAKAGMPWMNKLFDEIDTGRKGYALRKTSRRSWPSNARGAIPHHSDGYAAPSAALTCRR
ncbi:hypothetical protein OL229_14125 [Neisseriaceae bacterium JH1-16]|nr:hypothetical protein [Neisseriaceae bacterium JH1-16]